MSERGACGRRCIERRSFLKAAAVTGIGAAKIGAGLIVPGLAVAKEFDPFQATSVDAVVDALGISDAQRSEQIRITAPEIAEDGKTVPVTVASGIPDTAEIIMLVATNPKPLAARNRFGKGAETAFSSRVKMRKTTDVIVFVKAGERYYTARRQVKVTLGGCGG